MFPGFELRKLARAVIGRHQTHRRQRYPMQPDEIFETLSPLRDDLALALRAAAAQSLSEGVCNHFSVAVPGTIGFCSTREACTGVRCKRPTS